MKILINALDDEPVILEWLQHVFDDEIYDLKVFKKPQDFIAAFLPDVDLIITDMRVPGYDIYSTLEHFREIKRGVYVIVISAYLDVNICQRLFELDVNRVIEKSRPEWIHLIERYVNQLFPRIHKRAEILQ
jgi:DNA-binding NtrC family response regulator